MSRNSKVKRQHEVADQWSQQRKQGKKGPAKTVKKNKKVKVWWRKTAEERAKEKKKIQQEEQTNE